MDLTPTEEVAIFLSDIVSTLLTTSHEIHFKGFFFHGRQSVAAMRGATAQMNPNLGIFITVLINKDRDKWTEIYLQAICLK